MHAGTPSARQSQAQYTAHPCTLLGPGLSSDWRQAIVLQLCPSSSPTICPLKELWFRFICLQWRSICLWNTFYSFKAPEIKFSCRPRPCSHNCITLNQQKCLATRHHPSAQMFPPKHGHLCSDQWGWTRGAEPIALFLPISGAAPLQYHLLSFSFLPSHWSFPRPGTASSSPSVEEEGVDLLLILQAPVHVYFGAPLKAKWHLHAWCYRMRAQCFKASQKTYRTVNMI